jgi:hypothetical protein
MHAGHCSQGDIVNVDVGDPVMLQVLAQHLGRRGGLEGEHAALVRQLGEQDGVVADIGADIEDPPIRLHVVDEPALRLQFAEGIVAAELLVEGNQLDGRPPRDSCFHALFDRRRWHRRP